MKKCLDKRGEVSVSVHMGRVTSAPFQVGLMCWFVQDDPAVI